MRISKKEKALHYLILTFLAVCFLLPFLWLLLASFDVHATQAIKLPEKLSLDNFQAILADPTNIRSFLIGLFISLGQAAIVVVVAALAAYPLSRYRLRYKKSFLLSILFMTSLPITAVMVPVYQLFLFLHIQDSIIATTIFLAAAALPYAIWMMKNFMDAVPVELEESAWVDGASTLTGLVKIIGPLMLPGIFTIGIFTFTGSWGNFFVPYILLQTQDKLPASVTLYQFFGNYGIIEYGKLAAFSFLYTLPSVVLYIFSQKYMSKGFSLGGATKG